MFQIGSFKIREYPARWETIRKDVFRQLGAKLSLRDMREDDEDSEDGMAGGKPVFGLTFP